MIERILAKLRPGGCVEHFDEILVSDTAGGPGPGRVKELGAERLCGNVAMLHRHIEG